MLKPDLKVFKHANSNIYKAVKVNIYAQFIFSQNTLYLYTGNFSEEKENKLWLDLIT